MNVQLLGQPCQSVPLSNAASLLQTVLATSSDCIEILDLDGRILYMTEAGRRQMGVVDFSLLEDQIWADLWFDRGRNGANAAIADARAGRTGRFIGETMSNDGDVRRWDIIVTLIRDSDGNPEHLLAVTKDLAGPLPLSSSKHRARPKSRIAGGDDVENLRSLTSRTYGEAAGDAIDSETLPTPISDLLNDALAKCRSSGSDISVAGPAIVLPMRESVSLAQILRQLASKSVESNIRASKKGAIKIHWMKSRLAEGMDGLRFNWEEIGLNVSKDPGRRDFNMRLMSGGGDARPVRCVSIEYHPREVIYRFNLSLTPVDEATPLFLI